MTNGHIDTSDEALASLDHAALVMLLNRLYAQAKEPPISTSTAVASTDDELRTRIRVVRERIAGRRDAPLTAPGRQRERPTPPRAAGQRARRPFAVIVTTDSALVKRARVVCQARGVVLVSVSSPSALATLTTNVTPTDVIVDGRDHTTDRDADAEWLRELAARGVRVRRVEGRDRAFDALSEIE